ncbi:stage III sporulation protein AG [Staphylospora marina]|uniref:stage III sporulation protein AG n=1 Tax=Staphylospora marina TaxID=2490858 RepID=UPI000F5B8EC7|nr:stage III sporulation protein AG [Staphylospora marina]
MWDKWFKPKENGKNRIGWLVIVGLAGVGAMILSSFVQVREDPWPPQQQQAESDPNAREAVAATDRISTMQEYEQRYQEQLEDVLGKIVGVDDVSVIVNLDSSEEEVVQLDVRESQQVTTETDKSGGERKITQNTHDKKTAYSRGENGEKPVVIKRLKPKVRGVLVVARGVEDLRVKAIVIEAVHRTLDVPMHRISVLPKG